MPRKTLAVFKSPVLSCTPVGAPNGTAGVATNGIPSSSSSCTVRIPSKSIPRAPRDPDQLGKPRPALHAFDIFAKDRTKSMKQTLAQGENLKQKLKEHWDTLDEATRKLYISKEGEEIQRYTKEMSEFTKLNPHSSKPKKPVNGYMLFLQEKRQDPAVKGLSTTELAKKVGELWKQLTPEEQQVYKGAKKEEMEEYTKQMAEFNRACKEAKKVQKLQAKAEALEAKAQKKSSKQENGASSTSSLRKPPTPFDLYSSDNKGKASEAGVKGYKATKQWLQQQWDQEVEAVQQAYKSRAEQLKAEYKEALAASSPALLLPKKPRTFMQIFHADCTAKLKQEHPNASANEMRIMVATQWGKLDVQEQQAYKAQSAAEKEKYEKDMADFRAKFPDWQKPPPKSKPLLLQEVGNQVNGSNPMNGNVPMNGDAPSKKRSADGQLAVAQLKKRMKKEERDLALVNSGAFLWFAKDQKEEFAKQGCLGREVAVKIAQQWKEMPAEGKEKFSNLVRKAIEVLAEAKRVSRAAVVAGQGSVDDSDAGDAASSDFFSD